MRIDRLELETPVEKVELSLHPRLTVVTGLGRLEREALTGEILGAMGPGRPGLSADLISEDGKYIQVVRPLNGPPSVTDAISGEDVTGCFLRGDAVDLLGSVGLDKGQARTLLRLGRLDVRPPVGKWEVIERLARLDQNKLWKAATALAEVEVEVSAANQAGRERRGPIAELEQRHIAVETATEGMEQLRSTTFTVAFVLTLLAMIGAFLVHPLLAIPFLLGACIAAGLSGWRWRQLNQAIAAEDKLLDYLGICTYLDYQLQRVEDPTMGKDRSRHLELMDLRRSATASWNDLTGGGVTLAWAVDNRPEIRQLSRTLGTREPSTAHLPEILPPMDDARLGALEALQQRVGQLSVLFPHGMPLLLDDPLSDLDDFGLTAALSAIEDATRSHQLILMSDDPRIVGWARQLAKQARATVLHLGGRSEPVAMPSPSPAPKPQLINA